MALTVAWPRPVRRGSDHVELTVGMESVDHDNADLDTPEGIEDQRPGRPGGRLRDGRAPGPVVLVAVEAAHTAFPRSSWSSSFAGLASP